MLTPRLTLTVRAALPALQRDAQSGGRFSYSSSAVWVCAAAAAFLLVLVVVLVLRTLRIQAQRRRKLADLNDVYGPVDIPAPLPIASSRPSWPPV